MADEEVVELTDDSVVEVDLGGTPTTPASDPPQRTRAVTSTADDAAAALTKALEAAEAERKARVAAEQTAQAERNAREQAERQAQQSTTEARSYREQAENTELTLLTNGIESANRDIIAAKAEYKTAFEAGDPEKMADAQAKMGKATAALDRLEDRKATYEARKAAPPDVTQPTAPAAPSTFEAFVSKFSPKAQAFLRRNPDCVPPSAGGSAAKNAAMMEGHYAALSKGLPEGSDEYYRVVEERISGPVSAAAVTTPARTEVTTQPAAAPAAHARQPMPSAPASRDVPTAPGIVSANGKLTLNRDMQEVALISYPMRDGETTDAWRKRAFGAYANEMVALQREQKIGRRFDGM